MQLIAIQIDSARNIIGYRIYEKESSQYLDIDANTVLQTMLTKGVEIEGIEIRKGQLHGSNGTFDRYAKLLNGNPVSATNPMVVLKALEDEGFLVADYKGDTLKLRSDDAVKMAKSIGIANGKIVKQSNGTEYISSINGLYENQPIKKVEAPVVAETKETNTVTEVASIPTANSKSVAPTDTNISTETEKKVKEIVAGMAGSFGKDRIHGIPAPLSDIKKMDEKTGMTVEQKILQALLFLKEIKPFWYCLIRTVKRVESREVPSMGVTVDTMYYNCDFVADLPKEELLFVLMHETMHLAFRHSYRKASRDHQLYNMAGDFYINKFLCEEFGLRDSNNFTVSIPCKSMGGNCVIKRPDNLLYYDSTDINTETTETIYAELEKNRKQQNTNNSNQQQQQGQQGQGQQGQGQQGQGQGQQGQQQGQGQQGQQGQGQQGQGQQGQGQGQQGQQQGQGQQGNQQGQGKSGQGQEQSGQGGSETSGIGGTSTSYKGKEYPIDTTVLVDYKDGKDKQGHKQLVGDLVESDKTAGMTEEEKNQRSKGVLAQATTTFKQSHTFSGADGDLVERIIEADLAPKIDWRKILQNFLIRASIKETTYSAPDRRFISRNKIMPGPKAMAPGELEGIKICIDTSGSIGDKELGIALAQIKSMLRKYKAKAEIVYWDTEVRVCEPFSTFEELRKIKAAGGGGTDVNCVFKYFDDNRDYRFGLKQPPSLFLILTDGYFGAISSKNKKHGKKVIWILQNDNDIAKFNPGMGTVAKLINE